MGKYNTVIFDLDGTLLDTLEDLTGSVNAALRKNHLPERTTEEIRGFVGNGILKLIERSVPGGRANALFDQVYQDFRGDYALHCHDRTKPYPGILQLLKELRRESYHLAIVSNKADFAVKKLKEIYFAGLIDVAIGERENVRKKPAPDTVITALHELGVTGERAVYVGDSDVDIETAENAGMDEIAVTWGFRSKEFLSRHGACVYAADAKELKLLL